MKFGLCWKRMIDGIVWRRTSRKQNCLDWQMWVAWKCYSDLWQTAALRRRFLSNCLTGSSVSLTWSGDFRDSDGELIVHNNHFASGDSNILHNQIDRIRDQPIELNN